MQMALFPCYAFWFNQYPHHISIPNELSISIVLEAIYIGVFYDILVYITDITEHEHHLGVVFAILRDKLFANQKKGVIGHSMIQYLGHWISSTRLEADEKKFHAMVN